MAIHTCLFSNERLRARFKGILYEINECEECGSLGILTGCAEQRGVVPAGSAEFFEVINFFEFLIRAIRNQREYRADSDQ